MDELKTELLKTNLILQSLMEVAEWWIKTNQLDHFEKATKIKSMIENY